jgi:hypothetical protein
VLGFGHLYTLVDLRVLHFRFESAFLEADLMAKIAQKRPKNNQK